MTGLPLGERIKNGVGYIRPFLVGVIPVIALAVAGLASTVNRKKLLFFSIASAVLGYPIYIGGDPWPLWRMLVPMMPIMLALALSGAHALFRRSLVGSAGAMALSLVLGNAQFGPEILLRAKPYKSDETVLNVNTAIVLNRLLPPGSSIGVEWAGTLPYFTDFRAIDFLGKMDRNIARVPPDTTGLLGWSGMNSVPGHNKYNLAYSIAELKPDYIQVCWYGHSSVCDWADQHYVARVVDGVEVMIRKDIGQ